MLIPESALYCLVELSSGSVVIDGVDVSIIGLTDLRKSLAIIPQEPISILFRDWGPACFDAFFCFLLAFMQVISTSRRDD
jgi:hypothetical protein